jgi:hypothetical protein
VREKRQMGTPRAVRRASSGKSSPINGARSFSPPPRTLSGNPGSSPTHLDPLRSHAHAQAPGRGDFPRTAFLRLRRSGAGWFATGARMAAKFVRAGPTALIQKRKPSFPDRDLSGVVSAGASRADSRSQSALSGTYLIRYAAGVRPEGRSGKPRRVGPFHRS